MTDDKTQLIIVIVSFLWISLVIKKGWNSPEKNPILLPDREACSTSFLRVELSVSSWRMTTGLEEWRQIFGLCHAAAPRRVDVRFAPKTTLDAQSVYKKWGIDEFQQQMRMVWPIMAVKSCRRCKRDFVLLFITYLFFTIIVLKMWAPPQLNIENETRQKALTHFFKLIFVLVFYQTSWQHWLPQEANNGGSQ